MTLGFFASLRTAAAPILRHPAEAAVNLVVATRFSLGCSGHRRTSYIELVRDVAGLLLFELRSVAVGRGSAVSQPRPGFRSLLFKLLD